MTAYIGKLLDQDRTCVKLVPSRVPTVAVNEYGPAGSILPSLSKEIVWLPSSSLLGIW